MLESALSDVEHAFKQLEFAIKLMCYCERGDLDKEKFDSDVTIQLDEENVGFPDGSFQSDQEVVTASQINVGICFGVSAIVLDAAFEVAKIGRNQNSRDPKDELRVVSDSWWKLVFGVAPDHDGCSIRRRGQSAS